VNFRVVKSSERKKVKIFFFPRMSIDWQYQEEKQNFDLIENSYTDYPLFVCPIIGIKL